MQSIDDELRASISAHIAKIRSVPAENLAFNCGLDYESSGGKFLVEVFGKVFLVKHPTFRVVEVDDPSFDASLWIQNLIVLYLAHAKGAPLANEWISFRDLPGGLFYSSSFQGFSGAAVAKHFGDNIEALKESASQFGGVQRSFGDIAFEFKALARVPLLLVYWLPATRLPANCYILFDRSASEYLPTDALATVGGRLCRFLIDGRDDGRKALL